MAEALADRVIRSIDQAAHLASVVEEAIWYHHGERYFLDAYVIMPDHVHLLLRPTQGNTLAKIMQGLKGYAARELNKVLGRNGPFWQNESFDHLIRNAADWLDKFDYIHNNPVKAGLVDRPQDYPFSSLVVLHSVGRLESGMLESGRLESLPHTKEVVYHREPFATDMGAGKTHPIHTAHSYHSKIPHLATMPCIRTSARRITSCRKH